MTDYSKLLSVAQKLGVKADVAEAAKLAERARQDGAQLVVPLVGEFSAGKTTLVNALTDSKVLETATKPTTATIYEIHFGAAEPSATVIKADGTAQPADIHNLKNDDLKDAFEVVLCDTSKLVPPSIVLVDTPGLSSPDPKHRQVLTDFMPQADGILLVVDINAQLSRSLLDFVSDMKLANRPVFLVVTHCDGKTKADRESVRACMAKNSGIPSDNIAFVSATTGELDEFLALVGKIQADKANIQRRVDEARAKALAERMAAYIDSLLSAAQSDKEVEKSLRQAQSDLNGVLRAVDSAADNASLDLDEAVRSTVREFETAVTARLDAIAGSKGINFDQEAFAAVNSTASLIMGQFRGRVQSIVSASMSKSLAHGQLPLASAQPVDLSAVQVQGFSYNIDLNTAGHEHDAVIGKVALGVAAAAAVVATMGAAAPAAGAAAAAEGAAGGVAALGSSTAVEAVEVGIMAHQANKLAKVQRQAEQLSRMQRLQQGVEAFQNALPQVENINQQAGRQFGQPKGLIESAVGWVSENVFGMGKPQRQRAVRNYVDGTLIPEFRSQLDGIKAFVVNSVKESISQEAQGLIEQKTAALNQLKQDIESNKAAAEQRKAELRDLKAELQSAVA